MNRSHSKHSRRSEKRSSEHRERQKEESQQKLQERRQALHQKIIFHVQYDNGEYEGTMKNDMKHGTGIFTYTNGNRYEGNWRNDKKEGQGIYTFPNGQEYKGTFVNGMFNGYGIYTFPNGEEYKGTFVNGMFNGYGIYTYTNGRGIRYEGEWKNDVKDGKGKFILQDGTYEGNWENGKIQPYGTMVKNGESIEGFFNIFQDDDNKLRIPKLNGYFITTLDDGTKNIRVYIDGVYKGNYVNLGNLTADEILLLDPRTRRVDLGDGIQDMPDDIPCPICYESLQTGNVFWLSGCHHAYHQHCLFQNYEIERRLKCPLDNIRINRENYFTIKRPLDGLRHAGRRSRKR